MTLEDKSEKSVRWNARTNPKLLAFLGIAASLVTLTVLVYVYPKRVDDGTEPLPAMEYLSQTDSVLAEPNADVDQGILIGPVSEPTPTAISTETPIESPLVGSPDLDALRTIVSGLQARKKEQEIEASIEPQVLPEPRKIVDAELEKLAYGPSPATYIPMSENKDPILTIPSNLAGFKALKEKAAKNQSTDFDPSAIGSASDLVSILSLRLKDCKSRVSRLKEEVSDFTNQIKTLQTNDQGRKIACHPQSLDHWMNLLSILPQSNNLLPPLEKELSVLNQNLSGKDTAKDYSKIRSNLSTLSSNVTAAEKQLKSYRNAISKLIEDSSTRTIGETTLEKAVELRLSEQSKMAEAQAEATRKAAPPTR
jgi:hypothetical protein